MTTISPTWVCASCGDEHAEEVDSITVADESLCESCFDDSYRYCESCSCVEHDTDILIVQTRHGEQGWCPSCVHMAAFYCDDCEQSFDINYYSSYAVDHGNRDVCDSCFSNDYGYCLVCDVAYPADDLCYDPNGSEYLCESCADEQEDGLVHDYSYTPDWIERGEGPMFFGVELEVSYRNATESIANEDAAQVWPDAILKRDSSIGHGVEIVSNPMSLEWARQNLNRSALENLRRNGCRSWNAESCGIHIHMSRAGFRSEAHLARFLMLVHRAQSQVVALAGRQTDRWASFDHYGESLPKQAAKKQYAPTRYRAVNLTNHATVEVRVFRGSLRAETILSHIELCAAFADYTARPRVTLGVRQHLSWSAFSAWLADHADHYPNLVARIADRVG